MRTAPAENEPTNHHQPVTCCTKFSLSHNTQCFITILPMGQILRVNIMDSATGISIFEKIWDWKGVDQSDAVEALIRSLYQFAREIDDGGP